MTYIQLITGDLIRVDSCSLNRGYFSVTLPFSELPEEYQERQGEEEYQKLRDMRVKGEGPLHPRDFDIEGISINLTIPKESVVWAEQ